MGTKVEATKTGGEKRAPLQFSTINGILGLAGILTVALGYFLLSTGSTSLAPILLVLGYVALLPLAIIL